MHGIHKTLLGLTVKSGIWIVLILGVFMPLSVRFLPPHLKRAGNTSAHGVVVR